MIKHIIREVEPEHACLEWYFEDDGLSEASGDYLNTLFIVPTRHSRGFNAEEWERVQTRARYLIDDFETTEEMIAENTRDRDGKRPNYKEVMESYGIAYNPTKCHKLKEWAKNADTDKAEDIAEFLTITTGHEWDTEFAIGYCQGDYVEMVYCPEHYKNGVKNYGEVWLGCAKEFIVSDLDENGEEIDSCGGYIVADCEAFEDEEYKRLVCEWACIPEAETQIEMINGSHTYTKYTYRVS